MLIADRKFKQNLVFERKVAIVAETVYDFKHNNTKS